MSAKAGAGIKQTGLVFAYDTGSKRSWKGKPTTNIITNTNLDTGWSKGYNSSIILGDTSVRKPFRKASQVVSFVDANGDGTGYWYCYGDYAPQDPSTTYCISIYARTRGRPCQIRAYTANNSEVGRQYTNTLTLKGDGRWHRLEFDPITTPSNTQSDSISFQFTTFPANQRMYLSSPQMTNTDFHVPYVDGTRAVTESIIDWKGRSTITTTSLSYASDNSFIFDGSTSYTSTPLPIAATGPYTILMMLTPNALATSGYRNSGGRRTPLKCSGSWNPGIWVTQNTLRCHAQTQYVDVNIDWSDLRTTMLGMTFDGTTVYNIFDGEIQPRQNVTGYAPAVKPTLVIGGESLSTNSYNWSGQIHSVQIYDRVLTADEIKRNFTALRGRFGV